VKHPEARRKARYQPSVGTTVVLRCGPLAVKNAGLAARVAAWEFDFEVRMRHTALFNL